MKLFFVKIYFMFLIFVVIFYNENFQIYGMSHTNKYLQRRIGEQNKKICFHLLKVQWTCSRHPPQQEHFQTHTHTCTIHGSLLSAIHYYTYYRRLEVFTQVINSHKTNSHKTNSHKGALINQLSQCCDRS